MARIRTIKPEFFHDEELSKLSAGAKLTFIGLWCYADREGRLEDRPEYLKAMLYPYTKVRIESYLHELEPDFITRYEVESKFYIQINSFEVHQRPHPREPAGFIPPPDESRVKKRPAVERNAGREGNGMDKGEGEGEGSMASPPASFLEAWNKAVKGSGLVSCRGLSKDRAEKCRSRLSERPLAEWESIFSRMAKTPFLNGVNDRKWRASFDWIIANETNALKVLEGKYDEAKVPPRQTYGVPVSSKPLPTRVHPDETEEEEMKRMAKLGDIVDG